MYFPGEARSSRLMTRCTAGRARIFSNQRSVAGNDTRPIPKTNDALRRGQVAISAISYIFNGLKSFLEYMKQTIELTRVSLLRILLPLGRIAQKRLACPAIGPSEATCQVSH